MRISENLRESPEISENLRDLRESGNFGGLPLVLGYHFFFGMKATCLFLSILFIQDCPVFSPVQSIGGHGFSTSQVGGLLGVGGSLALVWLPLIFPALCQTREFRKLCAGVQVSQCVYSLGGKQQ